MKKMTLFLSFAVSCLIMGLLMAFLKKVLF